MKTRILDVVQGRSWRQDADGRVWVIADADIDADGANGQNGKQWAYREDNRGLELLANAGFPGTNWYEDILVCDRAGNPLVFPGGGIASRTAYEWQSRAWNDPRRWVDSATVPYMVVGSSVRKRAEGIVLGCKGRITNRVTGASTEVGVLDIGPLKKVGEISIFGAEKIGIPSNPRTGGTGNMEAVLYEFWPGVPFEHGGLTYELQRA